MVYGLDQYDTEYGIDHYETFVEGRYEYGTYINSHASQQNIDTARTVGYTIPFSTSLSANKSVYLADGVKVLKIVNGKFTRNPIDLLVDDVTRQQSITKRTLLVPLLSGVLGVLIPRE